VVSRGNHNPTAQERAERARSRGESIQRRERAVEKDLQLNREHFGSNPKYNSRGGRKLKFAGKDSNGKKMGIRQLNARAKALADGSREAIDDYIEEYGDDSIDYYH
jgi:hypothetical protein